MSLLIVILSVLLAVETVALIWLAVRYRKAAEETKVRRVEAPNSHYASAYVRNREARERWEAIDLDRVHEVNREEVRRLLEKVRTEGVERISSTERTFLDQMAGGTGEPGRSRHRGAPSPGTP